MRRRHWIVVIVFALVGLAIVLVVSAVSRVREAAARTSCVGNFSFLLCALHNYADANGKGIGSFPSGTLPNPDLAPDHRLSLCVSLLPYIEQDPVYRQFDLSAAADDERNHAAIAARFKLFVCPSSGEYEYSGRKGKWKSPTPLTHYVGVAGVGPDAATLPAGHARAGAFGYDRSTSITDGFPDGRSTTLLLIETAHEPGHWAFGGPATVRSFDPGTAPYIGTGRPFGGFHTNRASIFSDWRHTCNAAMADASVRVIRDTADPAVLEALATVAGNEKLPADW